MRDGEWIPVGEPKGELEVVLPTAEIVRSCPAFQVPGARLTRDLKELTDSMGYYTKFFLVDKATLYARVLDPDGCASWARCVWKTCDV